MTRCTPSCGMPGIIAAGFLKFSPCSIWSRTQVAWSRRVLKSSTVASRTGTRRLAWSSSPQPTAARPRAPRKTRTPGLAHQRRASRLLLRSRSSRRRRAPRPASASVGSLIGFAPPSRCRHRGERRPHLDRTGALEVEREPDLAGGRLGRHRLDQHDVLASGLQLQGPSGRDLEAAGARPMRITPFSSTVSWVSAARAAAVSTRSRRSPLGPVLTTVR